MTRTELWSRCSGRLRSKNDPRDSLVVYRNTVRFSNALSDWVLGGDNISRLDISDWSDESE